MPSVQLQAKLLCACAVRLWINREKNRKIMAELADAEATEAAAEAKEAATTAKSKDEGSSDAQP